jgi:hypothetical protein
MGTLSSWAAFALCHHVVVQWSARRAALPLPFTEYRLLGDDLVIAEEKVALQYQQLMGLLGVTINLTKSVRARGAAEFAKRTFVDGEEVTGLLWDTFARASTSLFGYYQAVEETRRRGFKVSLAGCVLGMLGPPTDRKTVGKELRALLLRLVEPGAALESQGIWQEVLPAATVADYHRAYSEGVGTLSEDLPAVRPQDSGRWTGLISLVQGARLVPSLKAVDEAKYFLGSLDSLLGAQLRSALPPGADVSNEIIRGLKELHPAGLLTDAQIQEDLLGVNEEEICISLRMHQAGQTVDLAGAVPRLRILSRADKEHLQLARTLMKGSLQRVELAEALGRGGSLLSCLMLLRYSQGHGRTRRDPVEVYRDGKPKSRAGEKHKSPQGARRTDGEGRAKTSRKART